MGTFQALIVYNILKWLNVKYIFSAEAWLSIFDRYLLILGGVAHWYLPAHITTSILPVIYHSHPTTTSIITNAIRPTSRNDFYWLYWVAQARLQHRYLLKVGIYLYGGIVIGSKTARAINILDMVFVKSTFARHTIRPINT